MFAIATFLVVGLFALLFTRMATGALIATGMPPQTAAFQARSAFTGAGFTTTEAENVVNHPARRRIVSTTMFVGNLGVPTLVVTVVLGFAGPGPGDTETKLFTFAAGLAAIVLLAFTPPVTRMFVRAGQRAAQPLLRRAISQPAEPLLSLSDEYQIAAVRLSEQLPMRSIRGLQQVMPEVTVLGIYPHDRPEAFVTGPPVDVELNEGDQIVVLASRDLLAGLEEPTVVEPDPGS
jgi:hypothetical protein